MQHIFKITYKDYSEVCEMAYCNTYCKRTGGLYMKKLISVLLILSLKKRKRQK